MVQGRFDGLQAFFKLALPKEGHGYLGEITQSADASLESAAAPAPSGRPTEEVAFYYNKISFNY